VGAPFRLLAAAVAFTSFNPGSFVVLHWQKYNCALFLKQSQALKFLVVCSIDANPGKLRGIIWEVGSLATLPTPTHILLSHVQPPTATFSLHHAILFGIRYHCATFPEV
jgi:hypothetical protein